MRRQAKGFPFGKQANMKPSDLGFFDRPQAEAQTLRVFR
jgi:hypothetical protein